MAIFYYLNSPIVFVINENVIPSSILIWWKCCKFDSVLSVPIFIETGYGAKEV